MKPQTGIDKIALSTQNFSIRDAKNKDFAIDCAIKQGGKNPPPLLIDSTGFQVEAWKMYHNSEKGIANYSINERGLQVIFNPSKLFHSYHLTSTGTRLNDAIKTVEKEMQSIGISCNIAEMHPTRIDVAAQSEMHFPLFQYEPAFRLLKGQRMKQQRQYEGGYSFGNTQTQTMFYDKLKELQYNNPKNRIILPENNLLRCEVRQLKNKSVAQVFNIGKLSEFIQLGPTDIENVYKSFLNKRIFARQFVSDQYELDFNSELEILKSYKKQHSRDAWKLYLMEINLDALLLKFGNIDNFGTFCMEAGYSRENVFRIKNNIRSLLQRKSVNDTKRGEVTTSTLLTELQEKFAA